MSQQKVRIAVRRRLLMCAAALVMPVAVHAVDATWTGAADGNWNTAGNWNAAVPTSGAATFNNNTNTAINLATAQAQSRLIFDTNAVGNFTFSGQKFIANSSGQAVTINSNVANTQIITFNNDFQITPTGRTTNFDWGFNNNSATANMIFNGAVFSDDLGTGLGGRLNISGTGNVALNGVVSNGASPGILLLKKTAAGVLTLGNANTFSGGVETTSNAGGIILGNKAALGTGAFRLVGGSSSTIQASSDLSGINAIANTIDHVSFSGSSTTSNLSITTTAGSNVAAWVSGTAPLVGDMVTAGSNLPYYARVTGVTGTAGSGQITFSVNAGTASTITVTTAPFTTANGVVPIGGSSKIEFSGTQNLTTAWSTGAANAATFNVTNSADTIFSGALQQLAGTASIVKTGSGKLILSGTNTYTGGTTISVGTLALGSGIQALGGSGAVSTVGTIRFGASGIAGVLQYGASNQVDYSSRFSGAAGQAFNIDTNGQTVIFASQLLSSGGTLTKFGTGTLITTSSANNYGGATTIGGGVLQLGNNTTTGSLPTASAIVNNAILLFNRNNAVSQGTDFSSSAISGSGAIIQNNTSNSYVALTLTSANTYTGTTTIRNGFLNVNANSILSGVNGPLGNATSAIVLGDASTLASGFSGAGPNAVLQVSTSGPAVQNFTISRNIDSSAAADLAGRNGIQFRNGDASALGTLTISGNWALSTGSTRSNGLAAQQAGMTIDVTGVISGGNSSTRFRINDYGQGVGVIRLGNASNSYASQTTVTNGTLLIAGDAASGSGVLGTNSNLILAETGNASNDNAALTDGAFAVGKTITLSNGGTTNSTWTLGGNQAAASSFSGNVNTVSNANSRILRLTQAAGGTVSFSGVIGANADLTGVTHVEKIGPGTVILTNDNSYDGTTTVTAGTLVVNNTTGSATGAGAVSVASGAALGGTGTMSGTVSMNGTLSPGNSIGTITAASFTLSSTATLEAEIAPTDNISIADDSDVVFASFGAFDMGGATLKLVPTNFSPTVQSGLNSTYTLVSAAGGISGTVFANLIHIIGNQFQYTDGLVQGVVTVNANDIQLNLTAVPEPVGILVMSMAGLVGRRRRHRAENRPSSR